MSRVKECKRGRGGCREEGVMPWQVRWASHCEAVYTGAETWRGGDFGSGPTWKPLDWSSPVRSGRDKAGPAGQEPDISWLRWLCLNPAANKKEATGQKVESLEEMIGRGASYSTKVKGVNDSDTKFELLGNSNSATSAAAIHVFLMEKIRNKSLLFFSVVQMDHLLLFPDYKPTRLKHY